MTYPVNIHWQIDKKICWSFLWELIFLQLLMADFCIDGKCHFPLPNKVIYSNETMIKILKEKSVVEIKGVLEKINKCQLCDLEIGLLCATLLIDPGTYNQLTGKNILLSWFQWAPIILIFFHFVVKWIHKIISSSKYCPWIHLLCTIQNLGKKYALATIFSEIKVN